MKPADEWRFWALVASRELRSKIKAACYPWHHWPIIIQKFSTSLPIGDTPEQPLVPANNNWRVWELSP